MNPLRLIDESLAVDGGPPVLPSGPPAWPTDDPDVAAALEAAVRSGVWGSYDGPASERLRGWLRDATGAPHAMPVCSGTIAVELALRGVGVRPGDEVVLSAYDFPGNFRAIEAIGARPVLVDTRPDGWTLDVESLATASSESVKALVVSHLHGELAAMETIRAWCDGQAVALVEDACQTPGAIVDGRLAGGWGDVAALSFGGSKLLTAGRGGALLTRRDDALQRATIFCERGNHAFPLSELQATALLAQRTSFPERQRRRATAVERLRARLAELDVQGLRLVEPPRDGNVSSYYKVGCRIVGRDAEPPEETARRRDVWSARLRAEGVAIDAGFRGFAGRTSTRCRRVGELKRARLLAAQTLVLHHPVLLESDETIDRVAVAIAKVDRRDRI